MYNSHPSTCFTVAQAIPTTPQLEMPNPFISLFIYNLHPRSMLISDLSCPRDISNNIIYTISQQLGSDMCSAYE